MAGNHRYESHLKDSVDQNARKSLEERDEKLILNHMKRNEKYLFNYTDCLSRKFTQFGKTFSLKLMKYPLSFNEMMAKFHSECSTEVLGEVEDCRSGHKKTGKLVA